jgi:hypothetical protein
MCAAASKRARDETDRMALCMLAELWNAFADQPLYLSDVEATAEFDNISSIQAQILCTTNSRLH